MHTKKIIFYAYLKEILLVFKYKINKLKLLITIFGQICQGECLSHPLWIRACLVLFVLGDWRGLEIKRVLEHDKT